MNENLILPDELIMSKILFIRNQKVMIDRDLAELYGITTKQLNQQVKRNLNRFPNHFMFQLTEEEKTEVVTNCDNLKNLKFSATLPYVFSEHGAMMVGTILNSERAVGFSIRIIEVFVKMRNFISENEILKNEIDNIKRKLINQDNNIELVFSYLDELVDKPENKIERTKIGYKK